MKGYKDPVEGKESVLLTNRQLAEMLGTTANVILRNYYCSMENYQEGRHFFLLRDQELRNFLKRPDCRIKNSQRIGSLYLWTEEGAMLLAKSICKDKDLEYYYGLIRNHYNGRGSQNKPGNIDSEEASMLRQKIDELIEAASEMESRVRNLENKKTVGYKGQLVLQEAARDSVLKAIGGTDRNAYKNSAVRGRAFAEIWKDYKDYQQVDSYKDTLEAHFEKARDHLKKWRPHGKLLREIEEINGTRGIGF